MIHEYKSDQIKLRKSKFLSPIIIAICIVINPFTNHLLLAQEKQKPAETKTNIVLSEQERKAVEGIFQDPGNTDRNVQFRARENVLVAKLLWNNTEIPFIPESSLAYVSKDIVEDQFLHIVFKKDSSGAVNEVKMDKIGVWVRAKNYKPVVKKEMEHTPDQLKPFEGLYQLEDHDDRFVQFLVKGNELVLRQHWDGNEISFVPETPLDFFSKEAPLFSLSFSKDKDGNIAQALAFKKDLWIKTKKVSLTIEQLKPYEGKFQSKDDPDNLIQLSARNNQLIVKQLWDGKEITLEPQTETYFYNDAQSYPLQGIKDKDGNITQVWVLGIEEFNKVK
jgi:hypothetical protein